MNNLSKNSALIILLIGGISLVGLAVLQYQWLLQGIELNRQGFRRQVSAVTFDVRESLAQHRDVLTEASLHIESEVRSVEENEALAPAIQVIRQTVDSILRIHNIPLTPRLYWRAAIGQCPLMVDEPDNEAIFNAPNVNYAICACHLTARHHLIDFGFQLQGEKTYLVKQSLGMLQLVVLFILILAAVLAYSLRTILKQKKLSSLKNDFINNLTHEFKTPIFTIGLTAKTLQKADQINTSEKLSGYVDLIRQENTRLKNQVDKVLQMALIDSGNLILDRKETNLNQLIQHIADSFRLRLQEQNGRISLRFAQAELWMPLDVTHFSNVIYNLLDNACKYTHRPPEIDIRTEEVGHSVHIWIRDNGQGMDEDQQKMVFDRFFRGRHNDIHNTKGFGLGLSYVKNIIELHKGKIGLESEKRRGTTFHISLPKPINA